MLVKIQQIACQPPRLHDWTKITIKERFFKEKKSIKVKYSSQKRNLSKIKKQIGLDTLVELPQTGSKRKSRNLKNLAVF